MRRHPNLAIRVPERVSKARAGIDESYIRAWFNKLEDNLKHCKKFDLLTDSTRVYNCDETNIQLCPKTGNVIGIKGWRNIYEVAPGPEKSTLTFIGTFSASGEVVAPTIIYPYIRNPPKDILDNLPGEMIAAKSDSGWMTSDVFFEFVVNIFNN